MEHSISSRLFCTVTQNCHRLLKIQYVIALHLIRRLTKFITLPIVATFLPVTFGYSLSSKVVVMRQLRR